MIILEAVTATKIDRKNIVSYCMYCTDLNDRRLLILTPN